MAELGYGDCSILVGEDRAPVWPDGLVGSITHTDDFVGAVVAPRSIVAGIGIDVEVRGSVERRLWSQVFNESEADWLETLTAKHRADMATVLFSAKEAFYKCQYCVSRAWLGFHDASLTVQGDTFRVDLHRRVGALEPYGSTLEGRFVIGERHVATGMALPAT
jgi:4'-phosphopantetheinyl transferase EntD